MNTKHSGFGKGMSFKNMDVWGMCVNNFRGVCMCVYTYIYIIYILHIYIYKTDTKNTSNYAPKKVKRCLEVPTVCVFNLPS